MRIAAAVSVALSITCGAALACPTASDMAAGGVWVQTDDGGVVHYRRGGSDVIHERAIYPNEDDVETRTLHGVYFLQDATLKNGDIAPGTVTRYDYGDFALPHPDSKGNWTGDITAHVAGEAKPSSERMSVTRGDTVETTIGGCTYPARIIITMLTFPDGGTWTTQFNYLSDLGIALFAAAGKTPLSYEEFYRSVSISATRP